MGVGQSKSRSRQRGPGSCHEEIGCQKTTRSTLTCTNCAMLRSLPGRFGNSTTSRSSPRPRSSWVKTPAEQHAPVPPQRRARPDRCATCAVLAPPTREVRCHAPPFNVYRCDSENARNQRTREPVALAMVFCRSAPSSGSHLSGDVQFQGFSRWCSASRVSTRGRGRCCAWRLRRLRNDDPDVLLGAAQTALTPRECNGVSPQYLSGNADHMRRP
jgi:hypothetical protein